MTPGPQPTRGCYLDRGFSRLCRLRGFNAPRACWATCRRKGREQRGFSLDEIPSSKPDFYRQWLPSRTGKRGALWSRNSVRNDIGGHPVTTPGSPPPVLARRLLDHWHRAKRILRQGSARGVHRAHNPWYQARMNSGSFGELRCVLEFAVLRTNRDARRLRTGDPAGRVRSP
jgi:hypothetical protein